LLPRHILKTSWVMGCAPPPSHALPQSPPLCLFCWLSADEIWVEHSEAERHAPTNSNGNTSILAFFFPLYNTEIWKTERSPSTYRVDAVRQHTREKNNGNLNHSCRLSAAHKFCPGTVLTLCSNKHTKGTMANLIIHANFQQLFYLSHEHTAIFEEAALSWLPSTYMIPTIFLDQLQIPTEFQ
jgi:hypothetical protein